MFLNPYYEELSLGSSPTEEDCIGFPYRSEKTAQAAEAECQRYIELLKLVFPNMPDSLNLRVKLNRYDIPEASARSGYYDVIVKYPVDDYAAANYAYFMEGNQPKTWEDTEIRKQPEKTKREASRTPYWEDEVYEPEEGFSYERFDGILVFDNDLVMLEGFDEPFRITTIVDEHILGMSLTDWLNDSHKHRQLYRFNILYVILHDKEQLRFPCEEEYAIMDEKFPELFERAAI